MNNDCEQWHVEGLRFKNLRRSLLLMGLLLFGLVYAASSWLFHADWLMAASAGIIPLLICWLASTEFRDKWRWCETKYRQAEPFESLNLKNTLVRSVEFLPGSIVLEYAGQYQRSVYASIPAEVVHVHASDNGEDYVRLKSVENHFTGQTRWLEVHLYLSLQMQQSMLSLLS